MKKLEIGICDNDGLQVGYLCDLIKNYFKERRIECNIRTSINSEELLRNSSSYNLVFLDIDMDKNDMNGIEIGKCL